MAETETDRMAASARLASHAARVRNDVLLAGLDSVIVLVAYFTVVVVRFDGNVPDEYWSDLQVWVPVLAVLTVVTNRLWGLYGMFWRHASVPEAKRLLGAGLTMMCLLIAVRTLVGGERFPLSVSIFGPVTATFAMGAVRFQAHLFSFRRQSAGNGTGLRVVVIGSGDAGAALVRDMLRSPRAGLVPVAVLDEDARRHGRTFMGLRIEGGIADLAKVAVRYGAHQAVLAMSSVSNEVVRQAANAAEAADISLRIVPGFAKSVGEGLSMRDIRDLEIEDLLGRREVVTDLDAVCKLLAGRRVLITGAGGSIGSEIARQVAACNPSLLVLLDNDETHLFDATMSIGQRPELVEVLADIRQRNVIDAVFSAHRPEVVFHAAAHKHVPLLEAHPTEAVATNVLGTSNVVDAAVAVGVEDLVLVSTDKAVCPASVMGASKRIAEQVMLSRRPVGARYSAVRFGNVLGSRGSVIPTFMRQIRAGGPVTVTDERMTRFFMSIPESVQLVLQAAALSDGGEIFMLDMGKPVRIVDLAQRMIRLSGRRVGADIEIRVTGVRPGEKLEEELREPDEARHPTIHPAITRLEPVLPGSAHLERGVRVLRELVDELDGPQSAGVLFELVTLGSPSFDEEPIVLDAPIDDLVDPDDQIDLDLVAGAGAGAGAQMTHAHHPGPGGDSELDLVWRAPER